MSYFFTADEHYYHKNILAYADRPFENVEEMNETLVQNHNAIVRVNDITIHGGDFALVNNRKFIFENIISRLNGKHVFLKGSHDRWLNGDKTINQIWERSIHVNGKKYYFVVCHYAMHTWARSHYGSYHLFGHSHGKLNLDGKRYDIGVDANNFFPVSDEEIIYIMKDKNDNPEKYSRR